MLKFSHGSRFSHYPLGVDAFGQRVSRTEGASAYVTSPHTVQFLVLISSPTSGAIGVFGGCGAVGNGELHMLIFYLRGLE